MGTFVSDRRGKAFSFLWLNVIVAVGLSISLCVEICYFYSQPVKSFSPGC